VIELNLCHFYHACANDFDFKGDFILQVISQTLYLLIKDSCQVEVSACDWLWADNRGVNTWSQDHKCQTYNSSHKRAHYSA